MPDARPDPTPDPTPEQVRRLPAALRATVPPEAGDDVTEHAGVASLLTLHARGKVAAMGALGLDPTAIATTRRNVFDLEHHLRYLDEVLAGDDVAVHVRFVGQSRKAVHGISFLLDETRGRLAGTCEFTCILVDLDTRRPVDIDGSPLAGLAAQVRADADLPWPAPLSGILALR